MKRYKGKFGVNWGMVQPIWIAGDTSLVKIERGKKEEAYDRRIIKFFDSCPVPSVFGIEHGHDYKFVTFGQKAGHDFFAIHTTHSHNLIKNILDKEKWGHDESAEPVRQGLVEFLKGKNQLFRPIMDLDEDLWELRALSRHRYKMFKESSAVVNSASAILNFSKNILSEEALERLEANFKTGKAIFEILKKESDKQVKQFFKRCSKHPVIKTLWWDWLEKLKGVGEFGAGLAIGEIYNIDRFDKNALKHYAQLCPMWSHNGEKIKNAFDWLQDETKAEQYAAGGKFRKQHNGRIKFAFFLIANGIVNNRNRSDSALLTKYGKYFDYYFKKYTRQGKKNRKYLAWKNLAQKIAVDMFKKWRDIK